MNNTMELLRQAVSAYEQLVVVQASQVGYMENALRGLFFFSPGRFRESELAIEFGYGALGLLGMYHDVVVLRHFRRATGSGEARLSKADWLRVGLTALQHTELFAEVAAQHRLGSRGKWTTVAVVELLKALVRLGLLAVQGGRMIVHQKVPERTEVLTEENQHLFTAEALAKIRSRSSGGEAAGATAAKQQPGEEEEDILLRPLHDSYPPLPPPPVRPTPTESAVRGGRSQRETILRRGGARGKAAHHPHDATPPAHESGGQALAGSNGKDADAADAVVLKGWALTGELLYILRPLAYLAAMYVWGVRSWRAWCCSLAVDVGAWACSSTASKSSSPELSRRTTQWAYYLVRSPFYEALLTSCVLRRLADLLKRLPFVTAALGMARSYVEAYRERYFYISGSSA